MATYNSFQAIDQLHVLKGNAPAPKRLISSNAATRSRHLVSKEHTLPENAKPDVLEEKKSIVPPQITNIPTEVNYGDESEVVEFKTSFFYKDQRVRETEQLYCVLKEVCAFLNNAGGTIYLGVQEGGKVVGLENDLNHFYAAHNHNSTFETSDGYERYICYMIRKKISLVNTYKLEITYHWEADHKVLALSIPKGIKEVARLDNGKVYKRVNAECLELSEDAIALLQTQRDKEQQMSDIEKKNYEKAKLIRKAKSNKRRVILHGYHSSNSATTTDRLLEVFRCSDDNAYIWAYEISSGKTKQFKLCRADSVEILQSEKWQFEALHESPDTDIFNMSDKSQGNVEEIILGLTLRAKNLLEEEFPRSRTLIKQEAPNRWTLKTTVHGFQGVGRFCMGLLGDVQIYQGDGLRNYIDSCIRQYMMSAYSNVDTVAMA